MSQYAEGTDPLDPERGPDPEDLDAPADLEDLDPEADDVLTGDPMPRLDVDDADLLEQAAPVEGVDDDYPNDIEVEPDV